MARKAKSPPKRKTPAKQKEQEQPKNLGCPVLYPTEVIINALELHHGLVYLAAKTLHCSPVTIYERAKKEPCIQEAINSQRGEFIDMAETKLWDKVQNGNLDATKFVLRTLGRNRDYVERVETRLGGDSTAPPIKSESTNAICLEDLSLECRKEMLAVLRRKEAEEANKSSESVQ